MNLVKELRKLTKTKRVMREPNIVDEYWTTEELLDEEVEVRKYNFLSLITEKYGWEQESRMGWFGISLKKIICNKMTKNLPRKLGIKLLMKELMNC